MKITCTLLLFSCIVLFACKKNDENKCVLSYVSVTENNAPAGKITYEFDDQGRVIKSTTEPILHREIKYYHDSIVFTTDHSGKTVYYLNASGQATSSTDFFSDPNPMGLQLHTTYEYNSEGYLIHQRDIFSQLYNGNRIYDTSYTDNTITNGNITKITATNQQQQVVTNIEYTNFKTPLGVPYIYESAGLGGWFTGRASVDLPSKVKDSNGTVLTTYEYSFANDRITTMTTTPAFGNVKKADFVYHCD